MEGELWDIPKWRNSVEQGSRVKGVHSEFGRW